MKNKSLLFTALLLASILLSTAQAPQQINYQAVVRNSTGATVPGGTVVGVQFKIHDGTATGSIIYTETTVDTANQFGLITHAIGSHASLAIVSWGSGPKWLEVLIDPAGGTNYVSMGAS